MPIEIARCVRPSIDVSCRTVAHRALPEKPPLCALCVSMSTNQSRRWRPFCGSRSPLAQHIQYTVVVVVDADVAVDPFAVGSNFINNQRATAAPATRRRLCVCVVLLLRCMALFSLGCGARRGGGPSDRTGWRWTRGMCEMKYENPSETLGTNTHTRTHNQQTSQARAHVHVRLCAPFHGGGNAIPANK